MITFLFGVATSLVAATVIGTVGYFWRKASRQEIKQETRNREILEEVLTEFAAKGEWAPLDMRPLWAALNEKSRDLVLEAASLMQKGEYLRAARTFQSSYDSHLPPEAQGRIHVLAGNSFAMISEIEEAEGMYRLAVREFQEANDQLGEAGALGNIGILKNMCGQPGEARKLHEQALALQKGRSDVVAIAFTLGNLANALMEEGRLDEADDYFNQTLELLPLEPDLAEHRAGSLCNKAVIAYKKNDFRLAEELYSQAQPLYEQAGSQLGLATVSGGLGNIAGKKGLLKEAELHHTEALALHRRLGNRIGEARDLANLGVTLSNQGRVHDGNRRFHQALELYRDIGAKGSELKFVEDAIEELRRRFGLRSDEESRDA